ncbi:MAG: aminotransferase class I/II-fold pyridoxal phosphate-dependent enzyme [Turicibacter sp.]|nr:aminotransferase class I/II-fold pyridoxal phosphate-dependent enzyme [Turicibacter sp.]
MDVKQLIKPNISSMKPSGIRRFFDLVHEMEGVISLGVGEPDFVTPWNVREAGIYSLEQGHTHYSSNAGFMELRHEIAKYQSRRFGTHYRPEDQVLVTVGGSEAIDLALRALVGPGDEVIIPEPSFVAYQGCTAFTGATARVIKLKEANEFKLTAGELLDATNERTKVLIMPFPNNPTGAIMTREELEPLVQILKERDIIVLSDEIYGELTYGTVHASIASFPEMYEKTVLINGFSKAFAMTGWRLGYACGHPDLIAAMTKIHQYAIMCSPTTAQYAAVEALKNGRTSIEKMVLEYDQRRRVLLTGLRRLGLECFEPKGAFYLFPNIKKTGLSSEEFCEQLLMQEKVLCVPGDAFGDCGEGFIRCCYASSMKEIKEALVRIERFMAGLAL